MFNFTWKPAAAATTYKSLQTSPNIRFSDVKGREEETEILKEKLLRISDGVRSISIQGTGGLGKTTLAKLVYNDAAVKSSFDKRIWICVSHTFDEATIAKSILDSLVGSASSQSNRLSRMLEEIHEVIGGQRYLLVLDDVWEESRSKWAELMNSISLGSPGSKILVTTRKGEVSVSLGCIRDDIILIGKVSEDACRAIFTQIAFHGWTTEEQVRVQGLCKDVVENVMVRRWLQKFWEG
ncbi:Disease resistance protein RGA2 [Linum perenne]